MLRWRTSVCYGNYKIQFYSSAIQSSVPLTCHKYRYLFISSLGTSICNLCCCTYLRSNGAYKSNNVVFEESPEIIQNKAVCDDSDHIFHTHIISADNKLTYTTEDEEIEHSVRVHSRCIKNISEEAISGTKTSILKKDEPIGNWITKGYRELALLRRIPRLNHTAVTYAVQEAYDNGLDGLKLWEALSSRCTAIAKSFSMREIAVILNCFSRRNIHDTYLFSVLLDQVVPKVDMKELEKKGELDIKKEATYHNDSVEINRNGKSVREKWKCRIGVGEMNYRRSRNVLGRGECDAVSLAAIVAAVTRLNIHCERFLQLLEMELTGVESDPDSEGKIRRKKRLGSFGLSVVAKACGKLGAKLHERLVEYLIDELQEHESKLLPQEIANFCHFFGRLNISDHARLRAIDNRIIQLMKSSNDIDGTKNEPIKSAFSKSMESSNFNVNMGKFEFDAVQLSTIFLTYAHLNIPHILATTHENYDMEGNNTRQNDPYFVVNYIVRVIPKVAAYCDIKGILKFLRGLAKLKVRDFQAINSLSKILMSRIQEEKISVSEALIALESYSDLKIRREWLIRKLEVVLQDELELLTFQEIKIVLESFKSLDIHPSNFLKKLLLRSRNENWEENQLKMIEFNSNN